MRKTKVLIVVILGLVLTSSIFALSAATTNVQSDVADVYQISEELLRLEFFQYELIPTPELDAAMNEISYATASTGETLTEPLPKGTQVTSSRAELYEYLIGNGTRFFYDEYDSCCENMLVELQKNSIYAFFQDKFWQVGWQLSLECAGCESLHSFE